ncbi:hypothetical protein ACQ4M3_14655 [Leptolyngbya sp. AN03gr2]|uniref:hypothetical protein n=1 Tax=unclassified Leptolyngbya TaxID=2650499 RepID=UPI003D31770E
MIQSKSQPTLDEIRAMIAQIPPQDLITLVEEIEARLQTTDMMRLAETGFQDWNDPEEDIYDFLQEARRNFS